MKKTVHHKMKNPHFISYFDPKVGDRYLGEDYSQNNNNNNNKQAFKRRISNRKETQCAEQVDKSSKQMYTRCRETT